MKDMLTADQARELLTYDPETGSFFWKVRRGHMRPGDQAGNIDSIGYVRLRLHGVLHHAHRLAWLIFYGEWPGREIDHVNGDRADNRIANLREANRSQQGQNKAMQRNNSSGFKGVCWFKPRGRWKAEICVLGERKHLGYFDDPQLASLAYQAAAKKHFGEFARLT